jgi:preprotein translocase subunit SecA
LEYMTGLTHTELNKASIRTSNVEQFEKDLIIFLLEYYDKVRKEHHENLIKTDISWTAAEKSIVLESIDNTWRQHMLNLDHLKEGIGLRGWGQKNPLIEYKREAFDMFREMMSHIRFDIIYKIFHADLSHFHAYAQEVERRRDKELDQLNFSGTGDPA